MPTIDSTPQQFSPGTGPLDVIHLTGQPLLYGYARHLLNSGTLTAGNRLTITRPTWFATASGTADVTLVDEPQSTPSSGGSGVGAGSTSGDIPVWNGSAYVPTTPTVVTATDIPGFTEAAQDAVGSLLVAGANVTLTYNDVANTLTVAAASGPGGGAGGVIDGGTNTDNTYGPNELIDGGTT